MDIDLSFVNFIDSLEPVDLAVPYFSLCRFRIHPMYFNWVT